MRKYSLLFLLSVLLFCVKGQAQQSLTLSIPDTTVAPNQVVSVPIYTKDFKEIVSMQFSLKWDPAIMTYQSFSKGDLNNVAIGDFQATNGQLRLSWFDVEGLGQTLPDGSVVVNLQFRAIAPLGSTTPLVFTDSPLAIQIFRIGPTPGIFDPVKFEPVDGSVTITEAPSISVAEDITQISCFGETDGKISLTITGISDVIIKWTGPSFTSDQNSIDNLAAGAYTVVIGDKAGDKLYESTINIIEPSKLLIDNITTVDAACTTGKGSATVVLNGGTGPFTYDIGTGPGPASALESLDAGTYNLLVADARGCFVTSAFSISAAGSVTLELGDTRQICPGEKVVLGAGNFASYNWSTGAKTPTIEVSTAGIYRLTVTNTDGCQASDEVEVQSGENVQLVIENDFLDICPNDSIQLRISGAETYSWIDTTNTLSALDIANPYAKPDSTTVYQVIGSSSCATDTVEVDVFVYEVLAMAGPDTCVGTGTEAQLLAFGGQTYLWADARYPVSDPTIPNPIAVPEDSITYFVFITDAQGCVTRDSMKVLIGNDPASSVVAANVITPNGDERNDVLSFNNIEKFGQNSLKIYNRWGNTVYQKVNYMHDEDRFDGTTSNGQPLPAGTYYYHLSFRTGDVKQKLTILR